MVPAPLGDDSEQNRSDGRCGAVYNPGRVPLELIEVQSGSYLGEDDIVCFEDVYGRG